MSAPSRKKARCDYCLEIHPDPRIFFCTDCKSYLCIKKRNKKGLHREKWTTCSVVTQEVET